MSLLTKRDAKAAGRARGLAAASWTFDGNTSDATYVKFLEGLDAGDPEVMDAYAPPAWLSGEWAGESVSELLGSCENARDEERLEDVMEAYEQAADAAYWRELERMARYQVRTKPCPSCSGSGGMGHCNRCNASGRVRVGGK